MSLWTGLPGTQLEKLTFDLNGVVEDQKHYGQTRIVNARSRIGYPKPPVGSVEDNWRMFSALSEEDIAAIQANYTARYERHVGDISPGLIGPNFVISGMEGFSKLPDGTLFLFENGIKLRVTSENKSCKTPGKLIASELGLPMNMAGYFVTDAEGYRGVVGIVLEGGILTAGVEIEVVYP